MRTAHAVPVVPAIPKRERVALSVLLALCALLNLVSLIRALPGDWAGRDFRQLYTAGYMVRTGMADELYDVDAQRSVQHEIFGKDDARNMYFIRPAYEALALAPLSFLSYHRAYFTLVMLNLGLVGLLVVMLSGSSVFSRVNVAVIILAFLPVGVAVFQGQDSIALTVIVAASAKLLERQRPLAAGMLAGLGLFKLQVVIPLFLLFLAWRRWRFSWGLGMSIIGLSSLSMAVTGIQQLSRYVRVLAEVNGERSLAALMPNLRGLQGMLMGHSSGAAAITGHLIIACLIAISLPKPQSDREALLLAIPAAVLCSYYLLIHDWALLLLPIVAALTSKQSSRLLISSTVFLVLIPSIVPGTQLYLLAVPLAFTLAVFAFQQRRVSCGCLHHGIGSALLNESSSD